MILSVDEPELPIPSNMRELQIQADQLFTAEAVKATLAPMLVRKFIIFPTDVDRFAFALGSAAVFAAQMDGGENIQQTPAAAVVFCGSVNRQFLTELGQQIDKILGLPEDPAQSPE